MYFLLQVSAFLFSLVYGILEGGSHEKILDNIENKKSIPIVERKFGLLNITEVLWLYI